MTDELRDRIARDPVFRHSDPERIAQWIERTVAEAPPLQPEQKARVARLLSVTLMERR